MWHTKLLQQLDMFESTNTEPKPRYQSHALTHRFEYVRLDNCHLWVPGTTTRRDPLSRSERAPTEAYR